VRIRYEPNFDPNMIAHQSFLTSGHTSYFIENADFQFGGEGDWGMGFGLIYVYVDDLYSPVIITPINLDATLKLDDGRAYVGFTAATGDSHWQAHDILDWRWESLYQNKEYNEPLIVNGEGAYECVNETACVHPVDYDHYLRTDHRFGPGYDNTMGHQTGKEGFCEGPGC
jgi:hypothetical protein